MASQASVIGRSARVRGRVTGAVDLEVQGFVDGEISVGGDVTVDSGGMVGAGVHGRRLVVRGAVKGDLTADEAILLEDGARVVGDVRAPRVAIAPGALVRGFVDTGNNGEGGRPASRAAASAPARVPAAASAPAKASVLAIAGGLPRPAAKPAAAAAAPAPKDAGPRRPPPPVVPALKKAKGQIAKKKER
jgi:cytoskeletal protein CcmA (bactofilin family)